MSETVQQIVAAIKRISGNRIKELTVQYHDGKVKIGGKSQSFYGRQLACHAVKTLGLIIEEDKIEVLHTV